MFWQRAFDNRLLGRVPLFVDGDKITEYPEFAVSYDDYVEHHKVKYEGVDAFLKVVGLKE